jgi:hypothetical protein
MASKSSTEHLELVEALLEDTHVPLEDGLLRWAGTVKSAHDKAALVIDTPAEQWFRHGQEALRRQLTSAPGLMLCRRLAGRT